MRSAPWTISGIEKNQSWLKGGRSIPTGKPPLPKVPKAKPSSTHSRFLVGRVEVKYGGDPAKTTSVDLAKYIDPAKNTVSSVTGELKFNYGVGLCTLDSPKAQGATGFWREAKGEVKLTDTVISSTNTYATVTLVALDDKPLRESAKVLVQVGTLIRPTGWTTQGTTFLSADGKTKLQGEKILNTGKMPWQVANTEVTVTLKTSVLGKAVQLDVNGYKTKEIAATLKEGKLQVTLPENCMYAILSE